MQQKVKCEMNIEMMEDRLVPALVDVGGFVAPATITNTAHTWTADGIGLYHTADLQAEWKSDYQMMLANGPTWGTPLQRLEGNAEAVFENTVLGQLGSAQQQIFREDVQREFDAIAAAQATNETQFGIKATDPLIETTYLKLESTLQNNPTLLELGVQGHGLNNPPALRYRGFTNDFQHGWDDTTLFIGGGVNNNQKAVGSFLDDNVLTETPFQVLWRNAQLQQLNQNGTADMTLKNAVIAMDDTMYGRVYTSADFSQTKSNANNNYVSPYKTLVQNSAINVNAPIVNGMIPTSAGPVSTTINGLAHTWVADANGLYHTTTDLTAEWKALYQTMLAGQAGTLTPIQRLEGNAEAVFENTAINNLNAATQEKYREDAQREFDVIGEAMKRNQAKYGTDPNAPFTVMTYIQAANTIQGDPTLLELGRQGHGLGDPPNPRYNGFTNDFQNGVDGKTTYDGGGLNDGRNALTNFFDDNIISHLPSRIVWQNGHLEQLNENGNSEGTIPTEMAGLNKNMYYRVLTSDDFSM